MSSVKKKKKRKSQAPVALVYFVTVLIFLGLFACLSVFLLKTFGIIGNNDTDDTTQTSTAFTNLYAQVNTKGVLVDLTVVRIDPDNSRIIVVPVPALTVGSDGAQTYRELFEDGGMVKLKEEVSTALGITIDNYMSVSNSAFERVADMFGGITYTPTEELYYLSQDNDENDIFISANESVSLSGRQIRLLCQYPVYSSGKQGNLEFLGFAVSQLINNAFQQTTITIDNMDNIYSVMTENSDTDLGSDAYRLQKSYVKDMISGRGTSVETLCPDGDWSEDDKQFKLSSEFKDTLRTTFSSTVTEESTEEGSED